MVIRILSGKWTLCMILFLSLLVYYIIFFSIVPLWNNRTMFLQVFSLDSWGTGSPILGIHKIESVLIIISTCYLPFHTSQFTSLWWSFSEADRRIQTFSTVGYYGILTKCSISPIELNLPNLMSLEADLLQDPPRRNTVLLTP